MTTSARLPVSVRPRAAGGQRWGRVVAGVLAAGLTAAVAVPGVATAAGGSAVAAAGEVTIPAAGGVTLHGRLSLAPGAGAHPGLVLVSSWGTDDSEYAIQAGVLASKGYDVLSYTPRGFGKSGGTADVAGPADVADVSTAIDWLTANTSADAGRIGVGGVSYGAGIGLLASARDPRIKAVAALSGWTDLTESLYGNATRHKQAVDLLAAAAPRKSAGFQQVLADFGANRNVPAVTAWSKARSAVTDVAAINRNHPAILLANSFQDSLFGPNQLVTFYQKLTGPKRIELRAGDHGTSEASGLLGISNDVWNNATRWFDQYLAGKQSGVTVEDPIWIQTRDRRMESYPTWAATATHTERYNFGPGVFGGGSLSTSPQAGGWSKTFTAGSDTIANAGTTLLTNTWLAISGAPPLIQLNLVDQSKGALFETGPFLEKNIRGIPVVHLTFTPSASHGTLVVYLEEVDAFGIAGLVTHAPYTYSGLTPGKPAHADIRLAATSWNLLLTTHHYGVVIDTKDSLYYDADQPGSTVTIGSPSSIDLPIGGKS